VILVVPPSNPVTTPVVLIVPLLGALVDHNVLLIVPEPPVIVPVLNGVVNPTHTSLAPVIVPATGNAFIVIAYAELGNDSQPLLSVTLYVIFVNPPPTPVTTPVALTVPLLGALVDHNVLLIVPEPPVIVPVLNGVVNPTHTSLAPVIVPATGNALTVTLPETDPIVEQPFVLVTTG
jgi:hypothetical protein